MESCDDSRRRCKCYVGGFYQCIVDHALDTLEQFVLLPEQKNVPIKAQIGKEQAGAFQDIPMAVSISDAVPTFGVYIKFFVQCEEVQGACARVSVACRMKNRSF